MTKVAKGETRSKKVKSSTSSAFLISDRSDYYHYIIFIIITNISCRNMMLECCFSQMDNMEMLFFSCSSETNIWWFVFGAVLVLTFATRFYKVTEPDHVW